MGNPNSTTNKTSDDDQNTIKMYSRLINMGFDEVISMKAANKYPSNLNKAIDYINHDKYDSNAEKPGILNDTKNDEVVKQKLFKINKRPKDDSDQDDRDIDDKEHKTSQHKLSNASKHDAITMNATSIDKLLEKHKIMMHKAAIDFDIAIFGQHDDNNGVNKCQSANCTSLKRLVTASIYYNKLNLIENPSHYELFTDFIHNIYFDLISDYIHFNNNHNHDIESINEQLPECDINSCKCTFRHHRTIKNVVPVLDRNLDFYRQTMDSAHFYLHHCFDVGLRLRANEKQPKEDIEIEEKQPKDDKTFDKTFSNMNKIILQRKHCTKLFDRFSTKKNAKFSIKTQNEEIQESMGDDVVFLDELYQQLIKEKMKLIDVRILNNFITQQEFDTDSIEYDIDLNNEHANVLNCIAENKFAQQILQSIVSEQISDSSSLFSIGFRFYYWDFYKLRKDLPQNEQQLGYGNIMNINDHSGFRVCELFIIPKYDSFKEEIENYKYFTLEEYNQAVVKVTHYQNEPIVKTTKAISDTLSTPYTKHYGIYRNAPLHFNHLMSLVIYCDYTELCSDFSSSFRKIKKFESINDIKKRNRQYYYLSKYIRETVECYGQCRAQVVNKYGYLSGPFYCGMSVLMNMSSFNIRLCSPTSTSVHAEIAITFSGHNGIIIQFDNPDTYQYQMLRGFNVSWISRFKYEAERLFVGGFHFIQIKSVTLINTNQNFENVIHALHCVDIMISGGSLHGINVSESDVSVMKTLFNYDKTRNATFHKYVHDTFIAFTQSKKQIIFDLDLLYKLENNEMRDLIMHPLNEGEEKRADNDFTNLFISELFSIFKNVKSIIIRSTDHRGFECYSLSMTCLLSLIESVLLDEVIIKAVTFCGSNWMETIWSADKKILRHKYHMQSYDINLETHDKEYWFLIRKLFHL